MSLRPSTAAAIQDMPPPGGYKKVNDNISFSLLQRIDEMSLSSNFSTWTSTLAENLFFFVDVLFFHTHIIN